MTGAAGRRAGAGRKGTRVAAAAALAGLALAGCGGTPTVTRSAIPTTSATTAAAAARATAAGNREQARREAVHLLALVVPPPGARPVPTSTVADSMPDPVVGVLVTPAGLPPGETSVVDEVAVWQVPQPTAVTWAWVGAHRPGGLAPTTTIGATGGSGGAVQGYSFDAPASTAWTDAQVEIGVAPAPGGGSFVRADGVAVWLDPVPDRDTGPGPRIHVAVAGPCPGYTPGLAGVTNDPPLTTSLLPPGRPTGGLVCRYGSLPAATRLDGPAAAALAAQIAAIPLSHVDFYVTGCPADTGGSAIVALAYAGRTVDVQLSLSGCRVVTNGAIEARGTVDPLPG